jgi:hypothetical protein
MLGNVLTRRAALIGLGAFASAGLSGCNTTPVSGVQPAAAPTPGLGGGAIDVDTSPLVAYVGNPTASWVQQSLPGALARVLGSGAPGGLHVRVDTLYLGNGGPADPDRMRGVAALGGRTINVRATSTYWPSPTDQALPEQALQGRVQALSVAFAYRLKRKLGA